MKSFLIYLFFAGFGNFVLGNLRQKFEQWVVDYNIDFTIYLDVYGKQVEHVYDTWVQNEKIIIEHNMKNTTYKLGHNKFSGLNSEEFSKFMGFDLQTQKLREKVSDYIDTDDYADQSVEMFPDSLDWRELGAVTNVKDQGSCGSCWAFSTTGSLEGAYQVKTGVLKSFSEQQLVSCDMLENGGTGGDHGCHGGMMDDAFMFVANNNGLCTEEDYPYTSGTSKKNGECYTTCKEDKLSDIAKYVDVRPKSDESLMTALMTGPVSVAIQANQLKFQLYKSGVLKATDCGDELDHGVLVVGWGVENDIPYWIVKNSWSESWGDNGYILLERMTTENKGSGTCGILSCPSYPILQG